MQGRNKLVITFSLHHLYKNRDNSKTDRLSHRYPLMVMLAGIIIAYLIKQEGFKEDMEAVKTGSSIKIKFSFEWGSY